MDLSIPTVSALYNSFGSLVALYKLAIESILISSYVNGIPVVKVIKFLMVFAAKILALFENTLDIAIKAGEKDYPH